MQQEKPKLPSTGFSHFFNESVNSMVHVMESQALQYCFSMVLQLATMRQKRRHLNCLCTHTPDQNRWQYVESMNFMLITVHSNLKRCLNCSSVVVDGRQGNAGFSNPATC